LGPLAEDLIDAEIAADVYGPLREFVARDGRVLLMGVTLTSMTLLHLAEAEAGRRPFIRWARGANGEPARSRGGECSKGFDNLAAVLAPAESRTTVGTSLWRCFNAADALRRASGAIRADPSITHCADAMCIECNDAVAGGPVEKDL
jgi:aminoglycoside 3-N-acetyltransferase